ncbi:hypothetical protein [Prevotella sp. oral taxon 317]|jgi:CRISPR-associated protein cas1|uniref:hypothetical protein n=1 Tax=Prevotella sp. oral taxon 317 TaxID=652721 RepID=UPI0009FE2600|nr:hypothetical protein [Prevotella sp. oral taxon 317]
MQKEEYLIKNACYSPAKYYLCKQNNKRSLLGRKQRSQVARSFPDRYLFSLINKVTSLFSTSCILRIILPRVLVHIAVRFGAKCIATSLLLTPFFSSCGCKFGRNFLQREMQKHSK